MSDKTTFLTLKDNVITRKEKELDGEYVFTDSNKVVLRGTLVNDFELDHTFNSINFYRSHIYVPRYSDRSDVIQVIVPDWVLKKYSLDTKLAGNPLEIAGQFRLFNEPDKLGNKHLKLYVYVTFISVLDGKTIDISNNNLIYLDGYLCKPPVTRKISNESHITDLHVAVNRAYNSSDYIPCIVWDASALLASSCKVGDRILLLGRIQSRDYLKHRVENPQESDYKRIYEVCIFKFKNLNASGKN